MRRLCAFLFALTSVATVSSAQRTPTDFPVLTGPYLGQTPPGTTLQLFAPGLVSLGYHEHGITFSPDGKELFFVAADARFSNYTILHSRQTAGGWSMPVIAPFSGKYMDFSPAFSTRGDRLYFSSQRPVGPEGKTKNDFDIWYVERKGDAWSEPMNLGSPVNTDGNEMSPTVMADGTMIYQYIETVGALKWDLYIARRTANGYAKPEPLPSPINTGGNEAGPAVSPDGRFLLFNSNRHSAGGTMGVFVTFRDDSGSWSEPVQIIRNIDPRVGEASPTLSPDGKYIFFSSFRNLQPIESKSADYLRNMEKRFGKAEPGRGTLYWVDASILEQFRPTRKAPLDGRCGGPASGSAPREKGPASGC